MICVSELLDLKRHARSSGVWRHNFVMSTLRNIKRDVLNQPATHGFSDFMQNWRSVNHVSIAQTADEFTYMYMNNDDGLYLDVQADLRKATDTGVTERNSYLRRNALLVWPSDGQGLYWTMGLPYKGMAYFSLPRYQRDVDIGRSRHSPSTYIRNVEQDLKPTTLAVSGSVNILSEEDARLNADI